MSESPLTPERWRTTEAILLAALEAPPERRDALLQERCAGDDALLADLRTLLAADEAAGHWLPPESVNPAPDQHIRRAGPFELERLIGRGGMGAVYLAHRADGQFEQKVAVKLIGLPFEIESFRERFRRERQILATLDHPNITRLLDGGVTPDGDLFLAMDYIDGIPLDEYCRQPNHSIPDRLRLFRQVCAAVQYAHQNLIIHRDIKPSNILVTPAGTPKLLDFGTAKLMADAETTQTGLGLMSVAYSSPEQLRGAPTSTLSDVFSLGVVLYQILTGDKLFTADLATRLASDGSPSLSPALGSELRDILHKALAAEPDRRYSSVEQFSEDLRRYLDGEPVLAHPPSLFYRSLKFARRNRVAVTAALLAVLLVTGAGIFSWRQARTAQRESHRSKIVSSFLEKMLSSANPYSEGRRDMKVAEVLDRASALAARDAGGDSEIEAQIRYTLGRSYSSLDDLPKAVAEIRKSVALAETGGYQTLLAWDRLTLGQLLDRSDDPNEAEKLLRLAVSDAARMKGFDPELEYSAEFQLGDHLRLYRQKDPADAQRHLEKAVQAARAHPELPVQDLPNALAGVGKLYMDLGRFKDAEPVLAESIRRFRAMEKMPLSSSDALDAMANLEARLSKYAEADVLYKEMRDLTIRELGPSSSQTLAARARWARVEAKLNHSDVAAQEMEDVMHELHKKYPRVAFSDWNIIQTYVMIQNNRKNYQTAYQYAMESLESLGPDQKGTAYEAQSLYEVGRSLSGLGRRSEAIAMLEPSLAIYRKLWGDGSPATQVVMQTLETARNRKP